MSTTPSLKDRYDLGADPTFRSRCQSAALQSAANVMSEDTTTTGHDQRAAFANKVLLNPALMSQGMAFGVAAAPAINEDSTDSDIQFTTNALWNAWSGVSTGGV